MKPQSGIQTATLVGLLAGFLLIGGAAAMSGSLAAFFNPPSILIVLGGTLSVTLISYSVRELVTAQRVAIACLLKPQPDASAAAVHALRLADRVRRGGLPILKGALPPAGRDPFLRQALGLVLDGMAPEQVERMLKRDIESMSLQIRQSAGVFRKAAETAPAMGLIGTLVGLVHMLGNLQDPSSIGPGMSVALLTTFYGAVLANMVLAPIAGKLEQSSEAEMLVQNVYAMAAASMSRQENPRHLEVLLNAILPPGRRVQVFD